MALQGAAEYAIAAVAAAAGGLSLINPEGVDLIITDVVVDVTTKSTAACTLAVGVAATSVSANTLLDALDVGTAPGLFDGVLNHGTAGKVHLLWLAGQYLTVSQGTGAIAGLVANLYVKYIRRAP
jgi:hypothetical protein